MTHNGWEYKTFGRTSCVGVHRDKDAGAGENFRTLLTPQFFIVHVTQCDIIFSSV